MKNELLKNFVPEYYLIARFFFTRNIDEIEVILQNILEKGSVMYDFLGYEYEDNDTLTFYDFTSQVEKSINVSIPLFLELVKPIIDEFRFKFPNDCDNLNQIIFRLKEL